LVQAPLGPPRSVMHGQMHYPAFPSTEGPTYRSLQVNRNKLYIYPMQAWYCIGLFIFIIAVFRWISFFHPKLARGRNNFDTEQASLHHLHDFYWCRIPLGLVNAYRVTAFR
jgi:ferric-chelate reductase